MTTLMHSEYTWFISTLSNIAWVVIAYILTVIDSFKVADLAKSVNWNGQGVGCLWLWVRKIVASI